MVDGATLYEKVARELDEYEQQRALECLTLEEAAIASGYSQAHLQRLVAEGTIPNAGATHRPRIRRQDLPRKPRSRAEGMPRLLDKARGQ